MRQARFGMVRFGAVMWCTEGTGVVGPGRVRQVWSGTVRYGEVRCGKVGLGRYDAVRYGGVRFGVVRCGLAGAVW